MATNKKHITSDKYNKALSLSDRIALEKIIFSHRDKDGSMTILLNDIADMLEKDPTTLSKEVKLRRTPLNTSIPSFKQAVLYCKCCAKFAKCPINRNFNLSMGVCKLYEKYICKHLKKFPWVCNGCHKKGFCSLPKSYYNPLPAYDGYRYTLVDSRKGITMSMSEFEEINSVISDGLKKKQSLEHILHSNDLPICTKTAYTYLHNGYFNANLLDTHRMVRFKSNGHNKPQNSKMLRKAKIGRQYDDFVKLLQNNPGINYCQMDTIEGKKGGKLILSLKLVNIQLQLYFLLNDKTAKCVVDKLNEIQQIIGIDNYKKLFGIILTDNGTEFTNINDIITDPNTGEIRTQLFFCHPLCSGEKGSCERSHEYFRYILPKGSSFNNLTQEKVNLITSHVNSAKRKSTDYSTPIELFYAFFGKEILNKLNISLVEPNDVILSPELIK